MICKYLALQNLLKKLSVNFPSDGIPAAEDGGKSIFWIGSKW